MVVGLILKEVQKNKRSWKTQKAEERHFTRRRSNRGGNRVVKVGCPDGMVVTQISRLQLWFVGESSASVGKKNGDQPNRTRLGVYGVLCERIRGTPPLFDHLVDQVLRKGRQNKF